MEKIFLCSIVNVFGSFSSSLLNNATSIIANKGLREMFSWLQVLAEILLTHSHFRETLLYTNFSPENDENDEAENETLSSHCYRVDDYRCLPTLCVRFLILIMELGYFKPNFITMCIMQENNLKLWHTLDHFTSLGFNNHALFKQHW